MIAKVTIEFDWDPDTIETQIADLVARQAEDLLRAITIRITNTTPVDTGYLRQSWYWGAPPQSRPPGTRPNTSRSSLRQSVSPGSRLTPIAPQPGRRTPAAYTIYRPLTSYLTGQQFLRNRGIYYIDNRVDYGHAVNSSTTTAFGNDNRNYRFTQRALQSLGYRVLSF